MAALTKIKITFVIYNNIKKTSCNTHSRKIPFFALKALDYKSEVASRALGTLKFLKSRLGIGLGLFLKMGINISKL